MGIVCKGHLDETWVTVLTAVDLSLLVNVITDYDASLTSVLRLSFTAFAAISLVFYCTKRSSDLTGIENDVRKKEGTEKRDVLHFERKQIETNYSNRIPRLFRKGRIVIILTFIALVFTFGMNQRRGNSDEMKQIADRLDVIEKKFDTFAKLMQSHWSAVEHRSTKSI